MNWIKDTAERVARTTLVAYLTYWMMLSTHDFADFISHQALLTATGAAVGTLLLCLGAAKVNVAQGAPASASFAKADAGAVTLSVLLLVMAVLFFVAAAIVEYRWFGVSGDHPLGLVALGSASFAAAHLPI